MKTLILLFIFGAISWLAGLIVCMLMARAKQSGKAIGMVATLFFCAPFIAYWSIYFKEWLEDRQFKADVAYVQELCAKYGGDKIYRTVDNVEGVFQITPRPPMTDAMWRDQYGMPDPWGKAQGDSDGRLKEGGPSISTGISKFQPKRQNYWFLEQNTADSESNLPYLRRIFGRRDGIYTNKLKSHYGYQTEDLSTPEMRKHWIAGGRIKIINLQTHEVLAERVGYFKAAGRHRKDHWAPTNTICPNKNGLDGFIKAVLKPPTNNANPEQINLLRGD